MRSPLLDDIVRDWENIQSPLVKMSAGFIFSQEMSTSAINHSLIPIKKALWTLHFGNEQFYIAHVTNHLLWFFSKWVVSITLLQIGTLDLLHEFANTEVFGLCQNCMWQSRHPEVDVYFLTLCEQIDRLFTSNGSPRSNSICVCVFVCVFVFILTFNRHIGTLAAK